MAKRNVSQALLASRKIADERALARALGLGLLAVNAPFLTSPALAACTVSGTSVDCATATTTTNTTSPTNPPNDRTYIFNTSSGASLNVGSGVVIDGSGLAIANTGSGNVSVTNNGAMSTNGAQFGPGSMLAISANGGALTYQGTGSITNTPNSQGGIGFQAGGNGLSVSQTGGAGSINIVAGGNITSKNGSGVVVRDVTTSTGIAVVTNGTVSATASGPVFALGIDVDSQSASGNTSVTANGSVSGGMSVTNSNSASTGNVLVNAGVVDNGSLTRAVFVSTAGTGNVTINATGLVSNSSTSSSAAIMATANGGNIAINAGAVSRTNGDAILATQNTGAGNITVNTSGDINGRVRLVNNGTGSIAFNSSGAISPTFFNAEGVSASSSGGTINIVTNSISSVFPIQATTAINATTSGGAGAINITTNGATTIFSFGGSSTAVASTGIATINNGTGSTNITANGVISGFGTGISAIGAGGPINITANGAVTALATGISVAGSGGAFNIINNNVLTSDSGGSTGTGISISGSRSGVVTNNGTLNGVVSGLDFNSTGALSFVNNGTVANRLGLQGAAVSGVSGPVSITNNGSITGNILLNSASANSFVNAAGGTFVSGAIVRLGSCTLCTLSNAGLLAPGGSGSIATTALTGNFTQGAGGVFSVDVNRASGTADLLTVSGTANLAGQVFVNNIGGPGVGSISTGASTIRILSAAGGVTNSGLTIGNVSNSAVATFALLYPNANDVVLSSSVNFTPAGLTGNQAAVGAAFNRAGSGPAALLGVPDAATLGRVYDTLSGEGSTATQQSAVDANNLFHGAIGRQIEARDFGAGGSTGDGTTQFVAYAGDTPSQARAQAPTGDAWRTWALFNRGQSNNWGDTGVAATRATGTAFVGGFDREYSPGLLFGFAGGYGTSGFNTPGRATSGSLEGGHVATYGAFRSGGFYGSAQLALDFFSNTVSRTASVPGTTENLRGEFNSRSVSGKLEAGYRARFGSIEIAPFAGLQFTALRQDGYRESNQTGPTTLGLDVGARTTTSLPSFVGAQINHALALDHGNTLGSWARVAWKHEFSASRSLFNSFIATPGASFVVDGARAARDAAQVNTGVSLSSRQSAATIFAAFDGEFSRTSRGYGVTGGVIVRW